MSVYTFDKVRTSICSNRFANELLKRRRKKVLCRLETFGSKARLVNITKPGLGW